MYTIHIEVIAALVATLVNPILVLLAIAAPWVPRKSDEGALQFWVMVIVALAFASSIAENGKDFVIWPGHTTFPSGHESFGAAVGACLVTYDRDWIWLVAPILAILGWALVCAGFHDPEDIYGGVVVGLVSALAARYMTLMLVKRARAANNERERLS